jgi:hypothetical protein
MDTQIIQAAKKEWQKIRQKYNGFNTIILDNWRGFRFIFDSDDVKKCKNNCWECPLFCALKKESCRQLFSPNLLPASESDKKLFGPQNFLNCKTLDQYQKCFANFLSQPNLSNEEIKSELELIQNLEIIFSNKGSGREIKRQFLKKVLRKIPSARRKIVEKNLTLPSRSTYNSPR